MKNWLKYCVATCLLTLFFIHVSSSDKTCFIFCFNYFFSPKFTCSLSAINPLIKINTKKNKQLGYSTTLFPIFETKQLNNNKT